MSERSEVIHCPNCQEDVPKTLYCLNCGYPLYKLQPPTQPKEEAPKEEEEVEMTVEIAPPVEVLVEEEGEEGALEPEEVETPELEAEEPPMVEAAQEEPLEPSAPALEPIWEAEPEEPPLEVEEPRLEAEEVEQTPPEESQEEEEFMEEIKIEYAPDPLTKEVMENLAKNITLKVRLVRLLRESQVKEETFKKLFESYLEQGRRWVSRRDEILRRLKADLERMEEALINARKDFDLLETRRSIGDASEEEYAVKAPAYRWDIENLEREIGNAKAGIRYVENLRGLIPEEEVEELKAMSERGYSDLDEVEGVSNELTALMKETLAEAYNILES